MDLLAAEGQAQTGLGFVAQEVQAELARGREDAIDARVRERLDGRDVERELERVPHPQRSALQVVGVGRDVDRPPAKLVVTSMNMVAAVMVPALMPVT